MLVVAAALAATGQEVGPLGLSGQLLPGRSRGLVVRRRRAPGPHHRGGTLPDVARDDASDVREVDCAQPHLFESVGPVTASPPPGAPFPPTRRGSSSSPTSARRWRGPTCRTSSTPPAATAPVHSSPRRPHGRGRPHRALRLQAPGRTGALFPSRGRVADTDQAVVFDPGVCLALVGKEVSDPVACSEIHAAEVAGTVDLTSQFPNALPSVDDQDNYLQPTCARLAEQYVGSAQRLTNSKLTVYWTNIGADSWTAGTRRVSCNLGSLLADNSGFAPLRGKAAEGVTIGGEAPASVPSLRPGAPATCPAAPPPRRPRKAPRPVATPASPRPRPPPAEPRGPSRPGAAPRRRRRLLTSPPRGGRRRAVRRARLRGSRRTAARARPVMDNVVVLVGTTATPTNRSCSCSTRASRSPSGPATTAASCRTGSRSTAPPLAEVCEDEDELREEVAVTVVHEIAHHFGIDEATLHDLGWG